MRISVVLMAAMMSFFACACERPPGTTEAPAPSRPAPGMPAPASRPLAVDQKVIDDAAVIRIVAAQAGLQSAQVKPSTPLDALKLDELDLVEIVMRLEKTFAISIPDERFGGDLMGDTLLRRLTVHDLAVIARDVQANPPPTKAVLRPATTPR